MLDSEENIHIITPPPSRARGLIMPRQECVSRLMLGISSCPTLISIYADNAADPDYAGGESNLFPLPCIYLPMCNAFPLKEQDACATFYRRGDRDSMSISVRIALENSSNTLHTSALYLAFGTCFPVRRTTQAMPANKFHDKMYAVYCYYIRGLFSLCTLPNNTDY